MASMRLEVSLIILISLQSSVSFLIGQNQNDAQWLLEGTIHLDFRNNDLSLDLINSFPGKSPPGQFSTSISSNDGELLFYSGGCDIINSNHVLMMYGDSLNPGSRELGFCKSGSLPWDQCITIIPLPGKSDHYLAFTLDIGDPFEFGDTIHFPLVPLHLLFHEIDMGLEEGIGSVVNKNNIVIDDTLSRGYLQAIQHANGRDWWVTVPEWNSNCYYSVLVSPAGIQNTTKTCAGFNYGDKDLSGFVHFSPDGTKYVRCRGQIERALEILDFDRCSGMFSNAISLNIPNTDIYFTGMGFSPDSRFVYVTTRTFVWQFDLLSEDVQNSIELVGELLPENAGTGKGTLYHQQIGPDGIIYIASPGSHAYLSTINRPNEKGLACDFQAHNIAFPDLLNNYRALPNNAVFRLGPIDGSACDSIDIDNVPVARFRYERNITDSLKFDFINLSYYQPEYYYWNFGDGNESYEKNPLHYFDKTGTYNVCLTVSNTFGANQVCHTLDFLDTYIKNITILNPLAVYPNPVRDIFRIFLNNNHNIKLLQIHNLTGDLVDVVNISDEDFVQIDVSSWPNGIYFISTMDRINMIYFEIVVIH